MKAYIIFFVSLLFLLFTNIHLSANDYPVSSIPDSLKTNAYAVTRNYTTVFSQTDKNSAVFKVTEVVTVFDEKGDRYAFFHTYGDKFHSLSSFSGSILDASGNTIKKIKKSDLTTSSISLDALGSDDYSIFYEPKSPSYPYTVVYTYEQRWKNGILSYPPFAPIKGYNNSLEKADYLIEAPSDIEIRYKSNYNNNFTEESIGDKGRHHVSLSGIKATQYEPHPPLFTSIFPIVLFAPSDFCYDNYCGNMSDWKNYGLWINSLMEGRDALPGNFIAKITEMTQHLSSDREKAKVLYEYLQNNFRYVSIQLGIGGYQPFPATSVVQSGFGDCKGLTNLMKAMLKAVGINSDYCAISTKIKELYPDYPNFNQMNHVILLVPFENDSVWLECTSKTLPFGYIHGSIAGHDALVITENGGRLHRLPEYSVEQDKNTSRIIINIEDNGDVNGEIFFDEKLSTYDRVQSIYISGDREKHVKHINNSVKVPGITIGDININENRSELPAVQMNAKFNSTNYINKTGNRYFVPLCPLFKGNFNELSSSNRQLDIVIDDYFSESDTVVINLPESFIPESLPKDTEINSQFGSVKIHIEHEGSQIIYVQDILINSGKYDKSVYPELKKFYSDIRSVLNRKAVIKKRE